VRAKASLNGGNGRYLCRNYSMAIYSSINSSKLFGSLIGRLFLEDKLALKYYSISRLTIILGGGSTTLVLMNLYGL
jgi:hypothetical protein